MAIWVVWGEELAALTLDAGGGGGWGGVKLCGLVTKAGAGHGSSWTSLSSDVYTWTRRCPIGQRELCKQKQFPLCTWSVVPLSLGTLLF